MILVNELFHFHFRFFTNIFDSGDSVDSGFLMMMIDEKCIKTDEEFEQNKKNIAFLVFYCLLT